MERARQTQLAFIDASMGSCEDKEVVWRESEVYLCLRAGACFGLMVNVKFRHDWGWKRYRTFWMSQALEARV